MNRLESLFYDVRQTASSAEQVGEITAAEWLVIAGGHELRHAKQIERLVEKIRP